MCSHGNSSLCYQDCVPRNESKRNKLQLLQDLEEQSHEHCQQQPFQGAAPPKHHQPRLWECCIALEILLPGKELLWGQEMQPGWDSASLPWEQLPQALLWDRGSTKLSLEVQQEDPAES